MSRRDVSFIVDTLLASEDLRSQFVQRRLEILVDLQLFAGIELTANEIAAFGCTDPEVWFLAERVTAGPMH